MSLYDLVRYQRNVYTDCVYSWGVHNPEANIITLATPQLMGTMSDFGPLEPWSLDVLSEEGEARICRMVNVIVRVECGALKFSEILTSSPYPDYLFVLVLLLLA